MPKSKIIQCSYNIIVIAIIFLCYRQNKAKKVRFTYEEFT